MAGVSSSSSSESERARRVLLAECAVVNVVPSKSTRKSPHQGQKRTSDGISMREPVEEAGVDTMLKQKAARILDAYLNSQIDFGQRKHTSSASRRLESANTEESIKGRH